MPDSPDSRSTDLAKAPPPAKKVGRKRDSSLDGQIIDSALSILAEVGFDRMTMDMVASRACAGKATLYRRWASKVSLVKEALIWMSQQSVHLDQLPDTGRLRDDLLAVLKPYSVEHGERKLRVLAQLGSFFSKHREVAEETLSEIFQAWTNVNRRLMERAIQRGEIPAEASIDLACEVIASMASFHSQVKCETFGKERYANLLDNLVLPALSHPPATQSS